jgi:uncharacterized membrane protein/protein-disulfide isomerase
MEEGNNPPSEGWFVSRWLQRRSLAVARERETLSQDKPYFCGPVPFIVLVVLAGIGVFAAGYLSYRHIMLVSDSAVVGDSILCRADGKISCDAILLSEYATLADHISSAVLGLMGCAFALWCALNGLFSRRLRKFCWVFLLIYFFTAIGFSWYFVYLMMFEMDNICTWCIVVHAVNLSSLVLLLVIAVRNRKEFLRPETSSLGERVYFLVGGVVLSLLIFFASGMWEKHLSLKATQAKYDAVEEDMVVIAARLNAAPQYDVPISDQDPVFGLPSAPFVIILFSDFQCPICPGTERALLALVSMNRDVLKLVYKNYPLSTDCNRYIATNLHPMACQAARAATATFILGGNPLFFAYGQLLFHHQKELKKTPWLEFAAKLPLDLSKFENLLKDGSKAAEKVQQDVELGIRLELTSTPQIFFEKKRLPSKLKPETLVQIFEHLIHSNHPDKQDLKLRTQ